MTVERSERIRRNYYSTLPASILDLIQENDILFQRQSTNPNSKGYEFRSDVFKVISQLSPKKQIKIAEELIEYAFSTHRPIETPRDRQPRRLFWLEPSVLLLESHDSELVFRILTSKLDNQKLSSPAYMGLSFLSDERAVELIMKKLLERDNGCRFYDGRKKRSTLDVFRYSRRWVGNNPLTNFSLDVCEDILLQHLDDEINNPGIVTLSRIDPTIDALGRLESKKSVPFLIDLLKNRIQIMKNLRGQDKYYFTPMICNCLGRIKDKRAISILTSVLIGKNEIPNKSRVGFAYNWDLMDDAAAAAWALGEIGSEEPVSELIACLKHKRKRARDYSAEALGKIGNTRAELPLVQLTKTKRHGVTSKVVLAFARLGNLEYLEEHHKETLQRLYLRYSKSQKEEIEVLNNRYS